MEKIVLLMDNDKRVLESLSEDLAEAGYTVLVASTIEDAEAILCNNRLHLAIMDIHMRSGYPDTSAGDGASHPRYDDTDISGLILAQDTRFRSLPKIILTKYPELDYVRAALGPIAQGPSPAVGFIAKSEGNPVLIKAVDEAFAQHVRLNWDLVIQFDETTPTSLLNIAEAIEPDAKGENLLRRAAEIEDLFRGLFYGKIESRVDRIKIQGILSKRATRIALSVLVFPKDKPPESRLVVCGRNSSVTSELSLYKDYSPRTHTSSGVMLQNSSQTIHFAANSYILGDASIEETHSLAELYRGTSDKTVSTALKALYQKTLPEWHKHQPILAGDNERLDETYRELLNLTEERMPQQRFGELIQSIARQAQTLGVRIERSGQTLSIAFDRKTVSYPDPTFSLWGSFDVGSPVLLMNSPGNLALHNILTDNGENVWVTDFSAAGSAPVLWKYLTLEAELRFDMAEPANLRWLHQMEKALTGDDFLKFEIGDIEAPLRKPMKAIQSIRKLASKDVGSDAAPYHLGILFLALQRLSEFNPDVRLTRAELTRYAHLLIGAGIILGRIGDRGKVAVVTKREETGISIDKEDLLVRVDGSRVPMRGRSFDLLCYLFDHLDRLTTRRELIEQVLHERYDAGDDSQATRLNTAISRLREKIESDDGPPRYLLTVPGGGYRLHSRAKVD
jgi:DNA-binding response OmpR family regulator